VGGGRRDRVSAVVQIHLIDVLGFGNIPTAGNNMKTWLEIMRSPVGMSLTWAVGWACVGMLIEWILNILPGRDNFIVDIWPAVMALAGLLAGALFSTLLRIAEGRRTFDKSSLFWIGVCGAVTGLSMGALAVAMGTASDVLPALWLRAVAVIPTMTLWGTASAFGLIALVRIVESLAAQRREPSGTRLPH
jgi:hypothetical protein